MHITSLTKLSLASLLLVSASLYAADVYSWKKPNGTNAYSDAPLNLRTTSMNKVNIRTQTVQAAAPAEQAVSGTDGLADEQHKLNQKLADRNKQIEKQNQKVAEENKQQQEENCKTARLNRAFAESARTANRDALIGRYDADIAKYCGS